MPPIAVFPMLSASGNCKPELTIAVVLPEPGGPIKTYHGNSYKLLRPNLDLRNIVIADFSLSFSSPNSALTNSLSSSTSIFSTMSSAICWSRRDIRITIIKTTARPNRKIKPIVIKRDTLESQGWLSPKPIKGPKNHISMEKPMVTKIVIEIPDPNTRSMDLVILRCPLLKQFQCGGF